MNLKARCMGCCMHSSMTMLTQHVIFVSFTYSNTHIQCRVVAARFEVVRFDTIIIAKRSVLLLSATGTVLNFAKFSLLR